MMVSGAPWFETLRPYLEINLLLCIGYGLARGIENLLGRFPGILPGQRSLLRFEKLILAGALLFPPAMMFLPERALWKPTVQVWSGSESPSAPSYLSMAPLGEAATTARLGVSGEWQIPREVFWLVWVVLLLGMAVVFARYIRQRSILRKNLQASPCVRRVGRVRVLIGEDAPSPFSAWIGGVAYVVIPPSFLENPRDFKIALLHELQHHRQGDTLWVHVLEVLKAFFFWNPAIYAWARRMALLQEFVCDEALIGRQSVSPQAYGRCLLRAVKSVLDTRILPVGTTGMATSVSGQHLTRRIEMILSQKSSASVRRTGGALLLVGLGTFAVMGSVAFATRSSLQDRSITLDRAQEWAEVASQGMEIPIEVNELVLARLNQFVGTPEGRRRVKQGLQRMPQYKSMIERKLSERGMPAELLAIPLFESGFLNNVVSPPPARAAGIWQFIPETARRYGLAVNDQVDDRLDPAKETEAAIRYYTHLFGLFQDWRLVLKAYNEGESRVAKLIETHDTRDPWELERLSTTESYLSGAIAMMIILKNPSILD